MWKCTVPEYPPGSNAQLVHDNKSIKPKLNINFLLLLLRATKCSASGGQTKTLLHTHARTHTRTHSHTHTRAHAHTHTHTQSDCAAYKLSPSEVWYPALQTEPYLNWLNYNIDCGGVGGGSGGGAPEKLVMSEALLWPIDYSDLSPYSV